jgi:hypothetical protein
MSQDNDLWIRISQLNAAVTAAPSEDTSWTWTAETRRRDVETALPAFVRAMNQVITTEPLPDFVTMANQLTIIREDTRILLTWFGFPWEPPRRLPSRVDAVALWKTLSWPAPQPYQWTWTWTFSQDRLRRITITTQEPHGRVQPVSEWILSPLPLHIRQDWTPDSIDDLIVQWGENTWTLSHLVLPLFEHMVNTRQQWPAPTQQRDWRRHLAKALLPPWLNHGIFTALPVVVAASSGLLILAYPLWPHHPGYLFLSALPLISWSAGYAAVRLYIRRKLRASPIG